MSNLFTHTLFFACGNLPPPGCDISEFLCVLLSHSLQYADIYCLVSKCALKYADIYCLVSKCALQYADIYCLVSKCALQYAHIYCLVFKCALKYADIYCLISKCALHYSSCSWLCWYGHTMCVWWWETDISLPKRSLHWCHHQLRKVERYFWKWYLLVQLLPFGLLPEPHFQPLPVHKNRKKRDSAFLNCKRWKAGQGLGTRLHFALDQNGGISAVFEKWYLSIKPMSWVHGPFMSLNNGGRKTCYHGDGY